MATGSSSTNDTRSSRDQANQKPSSTGWTLQLTGFNHFYNVIAWFVFGGALFAFCLARLPMLDIDGFYRQTGGIGEYYFYKMDLYRSGMISHLAGILRTIRAFQRTCSSLMIAVCNILAVFQFLPVIRHKAMMIHRVNGYSIFVLYLLGAAGGIVITRHAYGGHIETQTAAGALAILVLIAFAIAWIQIKNMQIDQHRKWMLRAIGMMASIVTSRIILAIAGAIVSRIDAYQEIWPCDQLRFTMNDDVRFAEMYTICNSSPTAIVQARNGYLEERGSSHRITFGMSLWLAVAVHIILMEFYIHLTPGESERLREASYERQ